MGVPRKLGPDKAAEIVAFRRSHQSMTLAEIGGRFGITGAYVSTLCQRDLARNEPLVAAPKSARPIPAYKAPRMTMGLTLSLLTSGRAPRAKLQPA